MRQQGSGRPHEGGMSMVRAVPDLGCRTAVKFFYHFPQPVASDVTAGFADCDVVVREFSKTVRLARDYVAIKRPGEFSAEFVVGGTRAAVYFDGSTRAMPHAAIQGFGQRLHRVGYDILYSEGSRPRCDQCPAGLLKACGSAGPR